MSNESNLTRDEVVQIARQVAQEVSEQIVQTVGQSQSGKTNLGYTSNTEDTQTDEAIRGKSYTDSEMWGLNKKLLAASEQREQNRSIDYDRALKDLELERKQHDFAVKQQLDAIAVSEAQQAALVKHISNHLSLDYRATVNESQLPVVDDDITVRNVSKDEDD